MTGYDAIVLRIRGATGGEESEVLFRMGGVEGLLSELSSDSVGTSYGDVAIDMAAAGVDRTSSSLSLRLNCWQGGSSTLEIEEIRLELNALSPVIDSTRRAPTPWS